MTIHITDGQKSIPLQSLRPDAWTPTDEIDAAVQGYTSATRLAGTVPVLYRCIDIRANAVAGVPYRLEKGGKTVEGEEYDALREQLRTMLWYAEAGLCFRAAYWEIGLNRYGKNPTPFWLNPWTVTPDIRVDGLHGYFRSGGTAAYLQPEQVLAIWNWDPSVEIGPGRAPVSVVLEAAGLLHALDLYEKGFFTRGGIKMTLLSVPKSSDPKERQKLKDWWTGMVQGVKSAFSTVVISEEIKPTVIGSDPKDTAAPELVKLSREDVMVGMGVPQSLVFSNPLAGGTVDAERLNFYDFTVLPRLNIIWPKFNKDYLSRLGLRAIPEPEKLEVYQASELRKAQGIGGLVGEPILLVDEGRAMLGKDPRSIAEQKLEIQIKDQRKAEGLPEPPPEEETVDGGLAAPALPAPTDLPPAELPEDEEPTKYVLDLARWETKALKRGATVVFTPDVLSAEDTAWIRGELATTDDIKSVFAAMKAAPGSDLNDRERVLYEKLKRVLAKYGDEVTASIVKGDRVDLSGLEAPLRGALLADLTAVALEVAGTLGETIGPDVDPAKMSSVAGEWARGYTYDLIKGLTETTRTSVQQAVASFSDGGLSSREVAALLSPTFGERRADMIAVTEIGRAAAQAQRMYGEYLTSNGIPVQYIYRTVNEGRVCTICSALNGQVVEPGDFPPKHARCRCAVSIEVVKK